MSAIKAFFSEVFKRHTEDDAEQVVIVGAPGTIPDPETLSSECPRPWLYTRVLVFFLLTTALLFLANVLANPGQLSNVLVIGAFAAPFTILVLFFEFNVFRNISFYTVLKALFIGGALSLIVTAVLPSFWFQGITSVTDAFVAGIGEEIAKLLVVYWILKKNRAYPYILNGLLVGAAVGAGFAIFETAGYGMFSLFGGDNAWLGKESMITLALRNLLAPGGHVIWAAISGAGLLMAARRESLTADVLRRKAFLTAFVLPVILHVLWDIPFFDSTLGALGFMATLSILGWVIVAWFVRRGLEEVDSMRALVPFRCESAPPPIPAGPWRRWAARILDLILGEIVMMVALNRVLEYFGIDDAFNSLNQAVAGIIAIPFLLLLEAIIFELFGTTFGKWVFSLNVRDLNGKAASSKSYLKRLVRLWVSGLGLGIPFVNLLTYIGQYRRISSGKEASYDESLGLRVDKGRIHPLRLLLVIPVLLLAGAIVLAIALPQDEDSNKLMEAGVDPSIALLVKESGLNYGLEDNGWIGIGFTCDDGRWQKCFVIPEPITEGQWRFALVTSAVAVRSSLKEEVINNMLEANITNYGYVWGKDGKHLVLRSLIPLNAFPDYFRQGVSKLAMAADACEKEITGKDEY